MPRNQGHQCQDCRHQQQRRPEMKPHALECRVDALVEQARDFLVGLRPGILQCRHDRKRHRTGGRRDEGRIGHTGLLFAGRPKSGQGDRQCFLAARQRIPELAGTGRIRFAVIAVDPGLDSINASFENQEAGLPGQVPGGRRHRHVLRQLLHLHDHVEQLRKTQQHQRHRVIAVEVGVQNQVGLVADTGQQIATGRHGIGLRGKGRCRTGKRLDKARIELAAFHLTTPARLGVPDQHGGLRGIRHDIGGHRLHHAEQGIAHHDNVLVTNQLLAGEINRNVLFVDENAGNKNDRDQIQKINQRQFAADAQATGQSGKFAPHVVAARYRAIKSGTPRRGAS
ncbi:hypothetical protein IMCC9480_1984 [Oxalobacteraceae bacterium IMCC9480]|nr:hypothetical protein IMCC9480_1984 [Oxalobacteraceae bacterium IMCC9480]